MRSHDRPIDVAPLVQPEKPAVRRARGFPYRDNRGLSHDFVLDDESLDTHAVNVEAPPTNLGVVGAAAVR